MPRGLSCASPRRCPWRCTPSCRSAQDLAGRAGGHACARIGQGAGDRAVEKIRHALLADHLCGQARPPRPWSLGTLRVAQPLGICPRTPVRWFCLTNIGPPGANWDRQHSSDGCATMLCDPSPVNRPTPFDGTAQLEAAAARLSCVHMTAATPYRVSRRPWRRPRRIGQLRVSVGLRRRSQPRRRRLRRRYEEPAREETDEGPGCRKDPEHNEENAE